MNSKIETRRQFIQKTSATTATIAAMTSAPAILPVLGQNDIIGTGHIGIGVRGGTLLTEVAGRQGGGGIEGARVEAICDVYTGHREKGLQRSMNPEARGYVDYKQMLADPGVDVVVVATPDHWHKQILIDAAAAGKDVYIEKGWTRSIEEAKAMRHAVKESGIVMQLGHQSRGQKAGVQAKELIDQGILGEVSLVETTRYINGPRDQACWRWYGWYNFFDRPDEEMVKANVDWDRWLGQTNKKSFNMEHFWHWRCYMEYGTGPAGDLLSHEIDFVNSVMRHGIPDTCMTHAQNNILLDGRDAPDTWFTVYGFEDEKRTVTFDCTMNSTQQKPPLVFRGKDAAMVFDSIAQSVNDFKVYAEPSDKYGEQLAAGELKNPIAQYDETKTEDIPSHMQDFFNCVRSRKQPKCNVDEAFTEAATIVMAVKAYEEKRMVRWDAEKEDVV
jgi:predicted dehydrogenase